jgi:hypothetical protein
MYRGTQLCRIGCMDGISFRNDGVTISGMESHSGSPRNVTSCPVCNQRMELLSRLRGYVTVGCWPCRVTLTVPGKIWDAARVDGDDARPESG